MFNKITVLGGMIIAYIGMLLLKKSQEERLGLCGPQRSISQRAGAVSEYIHFHPYTFWGVRLAFNFRFGSLKNIKRIIVIRMKGPADPINIVGWNMTPEEFADVMCSKDSKWKRVVGSYELMFAQGRWCISAVQVAKDMPPRGTMKNIRYHVRLFSCSSSVGTRVVLGNAHYEHHDGEDHKIISWGKARDEVVSIFSSEEFSLSYTEQITDLNWEGHPSTGRASLIYRKN